MLAGAAACADPNEPDDWSRTAARLYPSLSSTQVIAAPLEVNVGESFTVTVTSRGSSSCTRADGMDVSFRGNVVDLVPWDLVAPQHVACTDDLHAFLHHATVVGATAGPLVIRAHGRVTDEHSVTALGTVELVVQVR